MNKALSDLYNHQKSWINANSEVVIFGAGSNGVRVREYLQRHNVEVLSYLDNDPQKQGQTFDKRNIQHASKANILSAPAIVIASTWHFDIANQLTEQGHENFIDLSIIGLAKETMIDDLTAKLNWLESRLADLSSKEILTHMAGYLSNTDKHFPISKFEQYLHPTFKLMQINQVIDGGAWHGDTALRLIEVLNTDTSIHSFEPEADNVAAAKLAVSQYANRVNIVSKGLWDSNTTLRFSSSSLTHSASCNIDKSGDIEIEVCTIDDYCKQNDLRPDLIKLDVEGADYAAIKGAQNIIKHNKPKLAVCLYHDFDDLWRIPELIDSIRPDYNFYLGHHNNSWHETVLYCN